MKHVTHKSDYQYDLPESLIARYPLSKRSASRLLLATPQTASEIQIKDSLVQNFINVLHENDLLVMNNTRVLPARLFGQKETGGKVEIMVERSLTENQVRAYLRASKTPKVGHHIFIHEYKIEVLDKQDGLFTLESSIPWYQIMQERGEMPIPPYLARDAESMDSERYQTVFSHIPGAVAAPTAGLHFDLDLLNKIKEKGIKTVEVTLHVGAGTFQPVREEDLNAHVMHEEWYEIDEEVVQEVAACRQRKGRVIAIGTTSLRALESASQSGELEVTCGDTDLFISPGYQFKTVDALFTNFHLPESTLLMLVSAFAGIDNIRKVYQHAIENKYRFYSYGDAMFLANSLKEAAAR